MGVRRTHTLDFFWDDPTAWVTVRVTGRSRTVWIAAAGDMDVVAGAEMEGSLDIMTRHVLSLSASPGAPWVDATVSLPCVGGLRRHLAAVEPSADHQASGPVALLDDIAGASIVASATLVLAPHLHGASEQPQLLPPRWRVRRLWRELRCVRSQRLSRRATATQP